MLDFVSVKTSSPKKDVIDIYPEFIVKKSKDLMIRGRAFYAIWDEERGVWSTSEDDARRLIDQEIYRFADSYSTDSRKSLKLLKNFSSRKWVEFQNYCKNSPDNFHDLDCKVCFLNDKIKKTDYSSKCLPYSLSKEGCPAYDKLVKTLYFPDELKKLEWSIGAILTGDSTKIQKFVVLYGAPGSGKSTVLRIMEQLFNGYWIPFDSKSLGTNSTFVLESLRSNPLVAIQHEGDLSKIEDNTKINSIVSHESIIINEKFKAPYPMEFRTFMIMATNKPVKITDAKSGIIRRLIDIHPSGNKVPKDSYNKLMKQVSFELGAIANKCIKTYKKLGIDYYDDYVAFEMIGETNDFFNFVEDNFEFFAIENSDIVTLNVAWRRYKEFCEDACIPYPFKKTVFKNELKNYFEEFRERYCGQYNVYLNFKKDKIGIFEKTDEKPENYISTQWLEFKEISSLFDSKFGNCPAQYANENEKPFRKWEKVKTRLKNIDTGIVHYVKVPENLIVIDFDIKNEKGEKDYELNLEAANKWPKTYAELSKSGAGIHLHYIYDGDVSAVSRVYDENIEIKVFTGNSSLRRCLTKCNDIPIATISSGLPLREVKRMVNEKQIKSERKLRELIKRSLRKEIHGHTKPEIDFISHILDEAYKSGLSYDVRDMRPAIQALAMSSTNNSSYCLKEICKMQYCSDETSDNKEKNVDEPIIFFDVEVYPNLFVVCWKKHGAGKVTSLINPTPQDIEELCTHKLVGFNNRRYDNHILYARLMGYTEPQLFNLSQRIINDKDKDAMFLEAYNLSYTDIYDFLSSSNKKSLKKWEIELGIHHQEMEIPWDMPVPESMWDKVADYCSNDVMATEAVFEANQEDWITRQMLADISGLTVNDTTNQCTTRFILGKDKNPQSQYIYTDLGTIFKGYKYNQFGIPKENYIPGTKIVSGKSIYRGEDPGEGGYVYAKPGIYGSTVVLDVASMHPHSAIRLNIFGDRYTARFKEIVDARICIKHGDYEKAKKMLDGKLAKYLDDPAMAKALADALKTAINSVYGLTSAKFDNKLRDPRNKDNIVAKYGALFMINLKHEVQKRGFTVVHIKTDSIKIENATNEIISFVMDYGKEYGYTFEHESTYSKMCIVNDSVYIAQYKNKNDCEKIYGYIPEKNEKHSLEWTATGAQFKVPYVFKTLFSKEPIKFEDLCETKSVSTALYLDMNEELMEDHDYHFVGRVGQFCPMLQGSGGGVLLRKEDEGKFSAVTGTKKKGKVESGEPDIYRWMESEMVKELKLENKIDRSYYNSLVDEAVDTISKFGDFEQFVSNDILPEWMRIQEGTKEEELPFR